MFKTLDRAPPDPILGLTEAFKRDSNPDKINLSAGVYKDNQGNAPVFDSVKLAEKRVLARQTTKSYLPIDGSPEFARAVQGFLFGADHEAVYHKRMITVQVPGGTAALRVAADFIASQFPQVTTWTSEPTWPNHPNIFHAAGFQVKTYPYFESSRNRFTHESMLKALRTLSKNDLVLLHGCCHNPTGVDPTLDQWREISQLLESRSAVPLFDLAYQGLAGGLREDVQGVLQFLLPGRELMIASSFSKNFGLYAERVGALTLVADSQDTAEKALSHIKICIRKNYSSPPNHGAAIVTEILQDTELRKLWEGEVAVMRERINGIRRHFVERLKAKGILRDFSFIQDQQGMFSFTGLSSGQVDLLRNKYSIYLVSSGRINVAGITTANLDYLCQAISEVL